MNISQIRNFCIIAHIDHGKSTLADRLIEFTKTLQARDMKAQILDSMDIERERGITVKLQTVRMQWTDQLDRVWQFNLVDTPGHVDFSAEVSRSIASCEGAILLIDATQGVQAQTIANLKLARQKGLVILPVLNKIDSYQANIEATLLQLEELGFTEFSQYPHVSAKTGEGVETLLNLIPEVFPAPMTEADASLRAFIFDSHYDSYQGVVLHVRVIDGALHAQSKIKFMSNNVPFQIAELGIFAPMMMRQDQLNSGEVGYIITGIKNVDNAHVGDTLTSIDHSATVPAKQLSIAKPMVFCGIYPDVDSDIDSLKNAMHKLHLNDTSFQFEAHFSESLGAGFRCGFLGMLHREIIEERLKREFNLSVIVSLPSVRYKCQLNDHTVLEIDNPALFPHHDRLVKAEEPFVNVKIISPDEYTGSILELCGKQRGQYVNMTYLPENEILIEYEMPLESVIYGFFNDLKSVSQGYATLDYQFIGYRESNVARVDILLDNEPVDALAFISHKKQAYERADQIVHKLKYKMPRRLYPVPAQAVLDNRVIARVDIPPLRKSALGAGFEGSISAKKRMIRQQKEHKRRQKTQSVSIPREVFSLIVAI